MFILSFAVKDREQEALVAMSEQLNKQRRAAGKQTSSYLGPVARVVFVQGLQAVQQKTETNNGN